MVCTCRFNGYPSMIYWDDKSKVTFGKQYALVCPIFGAKFKKIYVLKVMYIKCLVCTFKYYVELHAVSFFY